MASQQARTDSHPGLYRPGAWPGERQPTQWDVHEANETPSVKFLDRFRAALIHLENNESAEDDMLFDSEWMSGDSETMKPDALPPYTFPMVMLSGVPAMPSDHAIAQLQAAFFDSFQQHVFLKSVIARSLSLGGPPPYLELALACLGAVTGTSARLQHNTITLEPSQSQLAADLFVAGMNLWSVMMEVDNRESRLCAAVTAAALLSTYGMLSVDRAWRKKVSGALCFSATILRRTHLTDGYSPLYTFTELPSTDFAARSALVAYLLLVETMHAIHSRRTPNLSVGELFIKMPSANHPFRTIYHSLIHGYPLPSDIQSVEDILLLLIAILNDIIYMQQFHLSMPNPPSNQERDTRVLYSSSNLLLRNPWPPLSLQTEFCRLSADMLAVLSKWHHLFNHRVSSDILALYYFARLQLLCPDLGILFQMSGYETRSGIVENQSRIVKTLEISDTALDLAWVILEHGGATSTSPQQRFSIWLPIVLFSSALVIWHKVQCPDVVNSRKYGTLSVLATFKREIANLPWPCCEAMAQTLDRLMGR